jgi:hypothetical protein
MYQHSCQSTASRCQEPAPNLPSPTGSQFPCGGFHRHSPRYLTPALPVSTTAQVTTLA